MDSYRLLLELASTVQDLEQVCQLLSSWHSRVVDGTHYDGEDALGDGAIGTISAAAQVELARSALSSTSAALRKAHSANGVIRWFDTVKPAYPTPQHPDTPPSGQHPPTPGPQRPTGHDGPGM